jgi:flagellar basal-body rod protein FlgF/flagellar basal-body rod protein FlgG
MDSGLYAACSGLMARMQSLDTIASNLANSSTSGFRGEKDSFGTVLAEAGNTTRMSTLNKAANTYSQWKGTQLDQTQGQVTMTNNDLDLAIEGQGYFKVQTPTGTAYTRDGNFQTDTDGNLTTAAGNKVLGEVGPIMVGRGPVTVSSDGTVSSNSAVVGKLSLVTFAPDVRLEHQGASLYTAPKDAKEQPATASVQQGALESSNVSPVESVVKLISAQRETESMQHVLTMLDNGMNKTAVQELARVS